jgi:hypothetical protein
MISQNKPPPMQSPSLKSQDSLLIKSSKNSTTSLDLESRLSEMNQTNHEHERMLQIQIHYLNSLDIAKLEIRK